MRVKVRTQAEFDAALKAGHTAVCVSGRFSITTRGSEKPRIVVQAGASLRVEAWGTSQPHVVARGTSQPHVEAWGTSQPHVEAWGTSQPHVEAWGTSQPHVEAWGTSQPHVEARGTSQPHVEAWETSQPHVEAWGTSQPHVEAWGTSQPHVEAWGTSQPHVEAWETSQPHVEAWGYVQAVFRGGVIAKLADLVSAVIFGDRAQVEGGRQIRVAIETPAQWCDYYGVEVEDGIATLYKAVNDDYHSPHGFLYTPGSVPIAPDWDGGERECGGGLHFSPTPAMAMEFHSEAKRFLACPVALTDIAVHPDGSFPQKVKARGCAGPVYEVDRRGRPVKTETEVAA